MTGVSHHTYIVSWSEPDQEFVATCIEFPSLSWLAPTRIGALNGLVDLIRVTVAEMEETSERL